MPKRLLILMLAILVLPVVSNPVQAQYFQAQHWVVGSVSSYAGPPVVSGGDRTVKLYLTADTTKYTTVIADSNGDYAINAFNIPGWSPGAELGLVVPAFQTGTPPAPPYYSAGPRKFTSTGAGWESPPEAALALLPLEFAAVNPVTPNSGPEVGGTSVIITGTNFQEGAGVTVGGNSAANITFVSASQITAQTPSGTGTVNVVVTNPPIVGGSATLVGGFTYTVGGLGPVLNLTVLLQGFYDPGTGTQKPAEVVVEARTGGATADTAVPANKVGETTIALNDTGVGSNAGNWTQTPAPGK